MAIQGLRNTTSFDTPNGRRPQNYRETLLMLYPNGGGIEKAPLTALTAVMKSEATDDPVYHWFTKQLQDRRLKLGADLSGTPVAGDTANITVDANYNGAYSVKEGDLLYAEQTGEVLYVNATPSTNTTISVIRGFDKEVGAALTAIDYDGAAVNPFLVVIGSAFEEGSAAPDPVSFDPTEIFNQTQIFRATYGLTGTAANTRTRLGSEEAELKREALENFGVDMERAFFFGKKTTTIRNGQPLRTTNGILSYIPTANRFTPASNGALTFDELENWSLDIFRYGSTEKLCFCGSTFLNAVSKMVRKNGQGNYELSGEVKEYGIGGIRRLRMPTGTLVLKAHPLFSQMAGSTSGQVYTSMDNAAVILDMRNIKYRYLKNRDVKFQDNLQLPGVDAKLAGWIAECGLEVHHPYTHSMISGVKTGAEDA